ncbi:hypothetical protein SETIT_2G396800v2 [Setaria italica]|uniref:Uncharacterized protein n=1 Tax=Setaria italica TaxID=4555 RepID=A0A368Q7Z5_SETIT|nr:hypothetical protein SETIT_2G396800v2 [Setaria italica]
MNEEPLGVGARDCAGGLVGWMGLCASAGSAGEVVPAPATSATSATTHPTRASVHSQTQLQRRCRAHVAGHQPREAPSALAAVRSAPRPSSPRKNRPPFYPQPRTLASSPCGFPAPRSRRGW